MFREEVSSKPRVLLVEDNQDDVFIFHAALERCQLHWDLHTVDGTNAAILCLTPKNHPLPHLLITAILLRGRSGHDLIHWVRSQSHLNDVPIVALSDTLNPRDRQKALGLGAAHFIVKTCNMGDAVLTISQLLRDHYPETEAAC